MTLPEKLQFLTAPRFWAMVLGAIALYLKIKGIIGDAEVTLIATITGGFVVVQTADKVAEKIGCQPVKTDL